LLKKINKYSKTQLELMYAAEILFGQKGINNTSHRDIINLTRQKNISAITYHFGGIDGIVKSLLEIRMSSVDADREKKYNQIIGNDNINNDSLMDAYIDPLYERCFQNKDCKNYIYFLKHLVSDYDFEFIDYLRNYSNATNLIEKEIRKINTLDNDQMWKTKVINNAAFITTSLAFRRRELDNNQKVLSKKKYLTYLKKSVLNIFLF